MSFEVFLFFDERSLIKSNCVSEVGKSFFEGIADLSFGGRQLPSCTKVLIFRSFEFSFQIHDDSILLLEFSTKLIVFNPVRF